jgi:arylformamidase
MLLYDVSSTIAPDMPVYKNRDDKRPRFLTSRDFSSSPTYEGRLDFDLHSGTHIDMPLHLFPEGDNSDSWNSAHSFTRCHLLDFSRINGDKITAHELEEKAQEAQVDHHQSPYSVGYTILLKTVNSEEDTFNFSFVYLEQSGANYLAEQNVTGVGIDALGIERDQPGHPTHKALLQSGIWILEGLRLGSVPAGEYILALLPLKISSVEALPARAVLLSPDSMPLL